MNIKAPARISIVFLAVFLVGIGVYLGFIGKSMAPTITDTPLAPISVPVSESGKQVVVGRAAGALVPECAQRDFVANHAANIIEGTVERVQSRKAEDGSIYTFNTLTVARYVKGPAFPGMSFDIVTYGGSVDGQSLVVEDVPNFVIGQSVRVYLYNDEGNFGIVCGEYGVEKL